MAKYGGTYEGFPRFGEGRDFNDMFKAQEKALSELQQVSDKLPPDIMKGRVVKWPVADGYAYYIVSETKPLTLQHIPFLDAYAIPAAHLRGLNLQDIKDAVASERWWVST